MAIINPAIRYFSKSKNRNSLKMAQAISEALEIEAMSVEVDLDCEAQVLFLCNSMYAANIDKEVRVFLENNADQIKLLCNICTSATGKSTYKKVKKIADQLGIPMMEEEFHCPGSWLAFNKGRPNQQDLEALKKFVKDICANR